MFVYISYVNPDWNWESFEITVDGEGWVSVRVHPAN
jgi:hypothetical protein